MEGTILNTARQPMPEAATGLSFPQIGQLLRHQLLPNYTTESRHSQSKQQPSKMGTIPVVSAKPAQQQAAAGLSEEVGKYKYFSNTGRRTRQKFPTR